MTINTFRYGDPPRPGDGLRIGTTRLPPRGVPRSRWQSDGYFDVWFPVVAPSRALLRRVKREALADPAVYRAFCKSYEKELLGNADTRQALELLAALSSRMPISVGCYCEVEQRCHRAHLRKLIERIARGG